jgi:DNA-binding response OmpR family regulator
MSKILVADDDTEIRNLCYLALTREGHEVITVPRGEQALALLGREKPDLILLDIQMPGEDGLSILRRISETKNKEIPVVIFSGFLNAEMEKKAYEAGAIEAITKGIGMHELCLRIQKILDFRQRSGLPSSDQRKEKILIVDDDENIRNLLTQFLAKKGFYTLSAQDGEQALFLVGREHPTLVLLDITMPGMDGLLTLKKIRELNPKIGVVMATAVQDAAMASEAIKLGAYAYVIKPFDLQYIELVVLKRLLMAA